MSHVIFTIFYIIVHSVLTFIDYISEIFEYTKTIIYVLYDWCAYDSFEKYSDAKLYENVQRIKKPPKHISILLGCEDPSYVDLSNLVIWSLAAGISFISFYDHKGLLKRHESQLESEINKKKLKDHIIWDSGTSTNSKNGCVGRRIYVKILSDTDGRKSIVNLCKSCVLGDTDSNINMDYIDDKLHKQFKFPDPDVGLYCGKAFNLNYYPPWQIRVTEFFNIKSHHGITFPEFESILLKFNMCDQRMGK